MQPEQQNNPNHSNINEMYSPGPLPQQVVSPQPQIQPVVVENHPLQWSSYETIYREKNGLWFIAFISVAIILIFLDLFLLKSYTFSILVVVMSLAIVVLSIRPPRLINYVLSSNNGLYIGEKLYHFNEFKAFGVLRDEGYNSIVLIPIKRFLPSVSVYFPQELGEEIVDVFGARLPMETAKLDFLDIVVKKLRI